MPINIPEDLPAKATLENENIFVMTEQRACSQDIRPLEIAIVNLMPTKIVTESQLLRMLSNTPLQVNITLIRAEEHDSKNTAREQKPQVRRHDYYWRACGAAGIYRS